MPQPKSNLDKLFLREEIKGEVLVNKIRLFLVVVFATLVSYNIISTGKIILNDRIALIATGFALVYSILLFFLLRESRYKRFIKFVSVTLDLSLIALTLASYQFDSPLVQPTIFWAPEALVFVCFIVLTGLRYSFAACIWAGAYTAIIYFVVTTINLSGGSTFNPFLDTVFRFTHPVENKPYEMKLFLATEIYRSIFFFLVGLITAFLSRTARKLLAKGVSEESEKNLLQMEHKLLAITEKEQKKYLENIGQGLLSFGPNLVLKEYYSAAVRPMFGQRRIEGVRFPEFLFQDNPQAIQELEEYLGIVFTNTSAAYEMIEAANPVAKTVYQHPEMGERHLAIRFKRVYQDDQVAEIMAIADDITNAVEAEKKYIEEKKKRQEEIELISAMLHLSPEDLEDFIQECRDVINRSNELLALLWQNQDADVQENVTTIFRLTHTMKGNAGNYSFKGIAEMAHHAEDFFSQLRDNRERITETVLEEAGNTLTALQESFTLLLELRDRIAGLSYRQRQEDATEGKTPLDGYLQTLEGLCEKMATALGKQIVLKTKIDVADLPRHTVKMIRDPLNHLVRNAADHGLESASERRSAGKPEAGTILISITLENEHLVVRVKDDGKGIDTEAIRQKAVDKGLLQPDQAATQAELIQFLFTPGFTTRGQASRFSGRGVGLDAVKDMVSASEGRVSLKTAPGKGTEISLFFPRSSATTD